MIESNDKKYWSPYLAGALSGLVLILSVWISGKFYGTSTTFVKTAGMIEKIFNAERVAGMDYFVKEVPMVDWQWMFVIGIFIGSFIAAKISGTFAWQAFPEMWRKRFGSSIGKRAIVAFSGGLIGMLGARLADGCPSGHGLSGSVQLAVSGFIALICFFIGGALVARVLYKGGERQ
jgi:uncharacterized membrane protein YedE/YeeE